MNAPNKLVMMAALSVALGLSNRAMAVDGDEPTKDQLNNSKDRGLIAVPLPVKGRTPTAAVTGTAAPEKKAEPINPTKTSAPSKTTTPTQSTTKADQTLKANTPGKVRKTATAPRKDKTTPGKSSLPTRPTAKAFSSHPLHPLTKTATAHQTSQEATPVSEASDSDTVVKAWLNKPGKAPAYSDGEKMEIRVSAAHDCNLVIFAFDGNGKLTQIFPNQYQSSGTVKAGDTVSIGGEASPFEYTAAVPTGITKSHEKIFVYAYPSDKDSAPLSVAMNPVSNSPFRQAEVNIDEYRKLVNQSQVFFARDVKITPRQHLSAQQLKLASDDIANAAPNKVELSFSIDAK